MPSLKPRPDGPEQTRPDQTRPDQTGPDWTGPDWIIWKCTGSHSANNIREPSNTVKPPLSSLLTNRHLLLPGTIFSHTCSWSAVCGASFVSKPLPWGRGYVWWGGVFSMQPQCLHSLHPVASPSSAFCKDAKCLFFAFIYILSYMYGHFLSYGHLLVPCCLDKEVLL